MTFVAMCLLIAFFLFMAGLIRKMMRRSKWNDSYEAIAKKYGGTWTSGVFSKPAADFLYGQFLCKLANVVTRAKGGGPFTQLSMNWSDPQFRMEVFPSWRSNRLWSFSGMQEVSVGSTVFNERFCIRTNDPQTAKAMLSDGVCMHLERLRTMFNQDDVYFVINRGMLIIKKPSFIIDSTDLDDFVRTGLELADHLQLTRAVGIDFVADEGANVFENVKCQICGDLIDENLVVCYRCKTPHCEECWHYYGQCSTYGCGEKRFVKPSMASEIQPTSEAER